MTLLNPVLRSPPCGSPARSPEQSGERSGQDTCSAYSGASGPAARDSIARPMPLPLSSPLLPQLAKTARTLPTGDGWVYEPKWDGFRALAFVDGDAVELQSRNGRPLTRYFPELAFPPGRYVLDGEIVLFDAEGRQDFDALGQRIHPAKSRIDMLAEKTPTRFVAFDLLAEDDEVLLELPQAERRERLDADRRRSRSTSRPRPRTPPRPSRGCTAPRA